MNYLERKISNAHHDFVAEHNSMPKFAICRVIFKDDLECMDVKIALEEFDINTKEDDDIFFYTKDASGLYALLANIDEPLNEENIQPEDMEMIAASNDDFAIIEFYYFE